MKSKTLNSEGKIIFCIEQTECCGCRVEWTKGLKPEACPFCGDPYFDKPNLEFKLFHLQDEFLADFQKTGSTRILGERMFPLIVEYAENLVKALLKGKALISYEELSVKANDAATLLIEVILKDPEHRMKVSFGGYLKRLCTNEAYRDKNNDQTYSMQYIIGDDTEFGDTISRTETRVNDDGDSVEETVTLGNRYDHKPKIEDDMAAEMCGLINKTRGIIYENTRSEATVILYLLGLHHKLAIRADKVVNGFYEVAGNEIRDFVEKGELVVYRRLRERQYG